jgi:hypothetical protein
MLQRTRLTIETGAAEVIVSVAREELALEQVRVEEGQRIFGIVPNFFVS